MQLTDEGIARFVEIVAAVREAVGWDIPLCIDHFGHASDRQGGHPPGQGARTLRAGLDGRHHALVGRRRHTARSPTRSTCPRCNGEDIYLWDGFREMIEKRAIDIIQPDLLTAGGMLETKTIADYAERYGLPTVLHFAGSPIAFMANLHCAAAIPSFVALEHHGLDLPFWEGLVTGLPENYMEDGYVARAGEAGPGRRPQPGRHRGEPALPRPLRADRRVEHAQAGLLAAGQAVG